MNDFHNQFPDFDSQLIVLPRAPPALAFDPYILGNLTSVASLNLLREERCVGFCLLPLSRQDDYHFNDDVSSAEKKPPYGVLLVPPCLQKICLIKQVATYESTESFLLISNGISNQLESLDAKIKSLTSTKVSHSYKIDVVVALVFRVKTRKPDGRTRLTVTEACRNIQTPIFAQKFECLDISFLCLLKHHKSTGFGLKNEAKSFFEVLAANEDKNDFSESIIRNFILESNDLHVIQLTKNSFKGCGGFSFTLGDIDKVIYVYKIYFPNKDNGLETLPEINQSSDSLLFKTDKDGNLEANLGFQYVGEVQDFFGHFVHTIPKPVGLLIRSFQDNNINCVFENAFKNRFEFDWIFCGQEMILGFEVARTLTVERPELRVLDKLKQVLTKHLPTMLLILHFILKNFPQLYCCVYPCEDTCKNINSTENFWKVVQKTFRFVIYLTNVTSSDICDAFELAANRSSVMENHSSKLRQIIEQTDTRLLSLILILAPKTLEEPGGEKQTLKIGSNYSIVPSDEDVFDYCSRVSSCSQCTEFSCGHQCCRTFKLVQYTAAILALSCLIEKNLLNDEVKTRLQNNALLKIYSDDYSRFQSINRNFDFKFSDIVLSPQQLRILSEHKRRVALIGEPGSGKTQLLLARAMLAARNSDIELVIFCFPGEKSGFDSFLSEFIHHKDFKNKIRKIPLEKLFDSIVDNLTESDGGNKVTLKQLHRSIMLVDEFYSSSVNEFTDSDYYQLNSLLSFLPHTQSFIVTNVMAGQMERRTKVVHRFLPPGCVVETLNILFRSSYHISSFSTNFIHTTKPISRSSARVAGCFTSSQAQVSVHYFENQHDPILEDRNLPEKLFGNDRMAIVFSSLDETWKEKLLKRQDITRIFCVSPKVTFQNAPYSGCEALSVIIILDEFDMNRPNGHADLKALLNLAISRAQFEVFVFVDNKFKKTLKTFFDKPHRYDKVLMMAANQMPVDLRFLENAHKDRGFYEFLNKLVRVAVQQSNIPLLETIFKHVPPSKISTNTFLGSLDCPKSPEFLEFLTRTVGGQIKVRLLWAITFEKVVPKTFSIRLTIASAAESLEVILQTGYLELLSFYLDFLRDEQKRLVCKMSSKILFSACYSGRREVLEWAFDFLDQFGERDHIERELSGKYELFKEDATLLSTLCYQNHDVLSCVHLLFHYNFPDQLLLETFRGKNPLHMAIWYENLSLVKLLLGDGDRKSIYLAQGVLYDNKSAVDYASYLGFEHIVAYLNQLGN